MRFRGTLVGVVAVALVGCGGSTDGGAGKPESKPKPQAAKPKRQPKPRSKPKPRPKPKPRYNAQEQQAYDDSKALCSVTTLRKLAAEYGGDPSLPFTVTNAYAKATYRRGRLPNVREYAASHGCQAGLRR